MIEVRCIVGGILVVFSLYIAIANWWGLFKGGSCIPLGSAFGCLGLVVLPVATTLWWLPFVIDLRFTVCLLWLVQALVRHRHGPLGRDL